MPDEKNNEFLANGAEPPPADAVDRHYEYYCRKSRLLTDAPTQLLEQIGALMAPAAAAPIAGCPRSHAAAAQPLVYLI